MVRAHICVDSYDWSAVAARDGELAEPEPDGGRCAEEDGVRDLLKEGERKGKESGWEERNVDVNTEPNLEVSQK